MSGLPSSPDGGSDAEDGNLRSFPLLFQPLLEGPARDAAVSQLSGDRYGEQVRSWCEAGDVYAMVDVAAGADAPLPAAAVVVARDEGTVEVARLVAPGPEGEDLAQRMLSELCDLLRRGRAPRVIVATTNVQVSLMELLKEAGFRFDTGGRDWSAAERGRPPAVVDGSAAHDLVWFEQSL